MNQRTVKKTLEEQQRMYELLEGIHTFVSRHPQLSYIEFDYYVVHDMTLFSVEPDFDFNKLSEDIHHIKKTIPAVKRIFNKPIIVLKDSDDVVPVENARIINQGTFLHLANHGQYVSNVTDHGVKPRKLLTRIYEDDYQIYENMVFCNYIDDVLSLVKKNRRILNSLLYASDIMRFNLLEKVNHVNYFLALGKLHTGYIRDFSQYVSLSRELLHELSQISYAINPRLHKPIYQKNLKRNRYLKLKKTNIFISQKDYKLVYKTYKDLIGEQKKEQNQEIIEDEVMRQRYLLYVQMLTIFAIGHFRFVITPQTKIDFNSLYVSFTFKTWKLDVFTNNKKEVILHFNKDQAYKMILVNSDDAKSLTYYKKNYGIDEVIKMSHHDEGYLEREDTHISIDDIDSFRRLQQIILKGMISSDQKRDICPFCGGKLYQDQHKHGHECHDCMIQIKEAICPSTKKTYTFTDNAHQHKPNMQHIDIKSDDYWYYEKQVESMLYYRNITRINRDGDILCPYCNKVHDQKK